MSNTASVARTRPAVTKRQLLFSDETITQKQKLLRLDRGRQAQSDVVIEIPDEGLNGSALRASPHLFVAYLLKMGLGRKKTGLSTIDACIADATLQESIQSVSSKLRAHYPPYGDRTQVYGFFVQQEDSPSRISNLKWDDHLPELRDNLALVRCDPFVVYSETVHWYEDEVDEEGDSVEEGLVRTNICPPWPAYATKQKLSKYTVDDYIEFAAALFSPNAHPIFLSFCHPSVTRADILEIRDDYLRQKFPELVPRKHGLRRRQEVQRCEVEMGLNYAWSLD